MHIVLQDIDHIDQAMHEVMGGDVGFFQNEDPNGALKRPGQSQAKKDWASLTGSGVDELPMKGITKQPSSPNFISNNDTHVVPEEFTPVSEDRDEDLVNENSTDKDAELSEEQTETLHQCVSCTEEFPRCDTIQMQCTHTYCHECILRLFESCLTNESLFPPRCCRIPIAASNAIDDIIGPGMMEKYRERKIELSDSDRTYCSELTCSRYIPPKSTRRGIAICESCMTRTCVKCKKEGHRGDCETDVSTDEIDDLLERLAKKKKWQRCLNCSRIIERINGCCHMTCRCGWQFCYVCGGQWNSCECSSRG